LAVPVAQAPQNVIAAVGDVASEGFVGSMHGLPVFVDPNIPVNLGAGTNEDRVIIAKASDVILFEGTPRSEAFRETKADQLSVLLRFYNYCALHSERYPKSISVISGTGLADTGTLFG
ncbi:phage major capsid protein, partial [Streptomyces albidoflavus]